MYNQESIVSMKQGRVIVYRRGRIRRLKERSVVRDVRVFLNMVEESEENAERKTRLGSYLDKNTKKRPCLTMTRDGSQYFNQLNDIQSRQDFSSKVPFQELSPEVVVHD